MDQSGSDDQRCGLDAVQKAKEYCRAASEGLVLLPRRQGSNRERQRCRQAGNREWCD